MRYIVIGVLFMAALLFLAYLLYQYFGGLSGTRSKRQQDRRQLHQKLNAQTLHPWPYEELNILSRNGESKVMREAFGDVEHGVLYSVYQEPILGFAIKNYTQADHQLLSLKFNETIYDVEADNGRYKILAKDKPIAHITIGNALDITDNDGNALSIDIEDSGSLLPVYTGANKQQMAIINADANDEVSRALTIVETIDAPNAKLLILGLSYGIINDLL